MKRAENELMKTGGQDKSGSANGNRQEYFGAARAWNFNPFAGRQFQIVIKIVSLRSGSPDGNRTRNLHLERVTS